MTALEELALREWRAFARYRGWHHCGDCERWMYCGRPHKAAGWVCHECWALR